ncbi:hypothetical protein [Streptomyces hypolithicus]
MKDCIARFFEPLLRLLLPGGGLRRRPPVPSACPYTYPYSCDYVGGPAVRRTGEHPLRGEDSPLVRPYLEAFERELAAVEVAERVTEARRGRALWLAVHGVEVTA